MKIIGFLLVAVLLSCFQAAAQTVVNIDTTRSSEMLRDGMFALPVASDESPWRIFGIDIKVVLDTENPFAGKHSPKIVLDNGIGVASIMQRDWRLQRDRKYVGYIWLKCCNNVESVNIMLDVFLGNAIGLFGRIPVPVKVGGYYRYDFEFVGPVGAPPAPLSTRGQLTITVFRKDKAPASVHVGRVSVMPADNVHGLRAEMLEFLHLIDPLLHRKHRASIAAQAEHDHETLEVQAATTNAGKALTVAIVNSSDREEAVKLDITGYDIAGKTVRQVVFAIPQNEQPQVPMTDMTLESFDGSIVVEPQTIALLLLEEPDDMLDLKREADSNIRSAQVWGLIHSLVALIRPRTTTVRGTITLDGVPIEGATVTLYPIDPRGVPAYGRTDADGSYTLQTRELTEVLPGEYKVLISKRTDSDGNDTGRELIPAMFTHQHTTPLQVMVERGRSNVADFELGSP